MQAGPEKAEKDQQSRLNKATGFQKANTSIIWACKRPNGNPVMSVVLRSKVERCQASFFRLRGD